jgi:hypothetical protein
MALPPDAVLLAVKGARPPNARVGAKPRRPGVGATPQAGTAIDG